RVGLQSGTNEREISTDYAIFRPTVVIKQTDLNVRTAINGSQDQVYAANQGESIQFGINWINNLSTRIVNGKVRATIEQGYFNRSSVESDTSGFFRSTDNTVIWDQSSNSSLVEIPPGASGSASFGFTLSDIPLDREKTLRNPQFNIDVVVEGTRFSDDN